jgi:Ca2+/Na+ antiporter
MDVKLLNTVPETLDYAESLSYIKVDDYPSVLNEIQNINKIIKIISLLFIILIFNFIFPYKEYKDSFNYKLYIALLVILLILLINYNDLYLIVAIFIIISLIFVPILMILFFYIQKNENINIIFQMYNNQLKNVFSDNFNYYELIFNIFFISIILVLSIVLYWDNIYSEAKKISKCGTILTIVEENTYRKNPYVYNIIVIDNNSLDTKISNHIIKIKYDFMKVKTTIEFVNNKAALYLEERNIIKYQQELIKELFNNFNKRGDTTNPIISNDKIKDFDKLFKTDKIYDEFNKIVNSEITDHIKSELAKEITSDDIATNHIGIQRLTNERETYKSNYGIKSLEELIRDYNEKISLAEKIDYITNFIIDNYKLYIYKLLTKYKNYDEKRPHVYYINLKNFNTEIIENISSEIFNTPEKYKILCVDENDKPIYNYSSNELIKFTQNYAINNEYNPSIIYDIMHAKNNNDKIIT